MDYMRRYLEIGREIERKAEGRRYLCTDCDASFNETPPDGRCGCGSGRVLDFKKPERQ